MATRGLCVLLIAALAVQTVSGRGPKIDRDVIRKGFKPYADDTAIVCRGNHPYANVKGAFIDAIWVGGLWFPLEGVKDVKKLSRSARSCFKIKGYLGRGGAATAPRTPGLGPPVVAVAPGAGR